MENKTKILIILDGSEENERSIEFILKSNFFSFDEISLFFILNPVNPVTKLEKNNFYIMILYMTMVENLQICM